MQEEISVKIQSIPDMWQNDCASLRLYSQHFDLPFEVSSRYAPNKDDQMEIILAVQQTWHNPVDPIHPSDLEEMTDRVLELLQAGWKTTIPTDFSPEIELLDYQGYWERLREIETELEERTGVVDHLESPPPSTFYPSHNAILVPNNFLIVVGGVEHLLGARRGHYPPAPAVIEKPWARGHLEYVLFGDLSNALFRHLRGELKEDYYALCVNIPMDDTMLPAKYLAKHLQLLAAKIIATQKKPEWLLRAVASKINFVYSSWDLMGKFLCANALRKKKKFEQIAMVDQISSATPGQLTVELFVDHPKYEEKRARYQGSR